MNIKNLYIAVVAVGLSLTMASCNDYLDKQPDSRLDLQSPSDVSKLLTTAYPTIHPAYLFEMYSDNSDCNINTGWDAASRFQEQAYEWTDITDDDNESPNGIWSSCYDAIATANIALNHINSLSADQQGEYAGQKGEALLCRAYAMFQLADFFCQAYDETTADTDLGLPYPETVETNVHGKYERGTLAQLYAKIEADLSEGLKLVGYNTFEKAKYHFNTTAAEAFAARFYLYYHKYDEAIKYADMALGSNPSTMLRDWASWSQLTTNEQVAPNAYISSDVKANFLLQVVVSEWGAIGGNYSYGDKYAHNSLISSYETLESKGPWGKSVDVLNYTVFFNPSMSKYIVRKIPYDFEYSDIQAGVGMPHTVYADFTADETLMVRAEAKAMKRDYQGAVDDLNTELTAFGNEKATQLTLDNIKSFYSDATTPYYTAKNPTPRKAFHTSFAIEQTTQEPLLQCILHLRRILTIHEGLRMQDVKRYGITIYRRKVLNNYKITDVNDTMEARDPRLAIQLPQDVINAGLPANPRNK